MARGISVSEKRATRTAATVEIKGHAGAPGGDAVRRGHRRARARQSAEFTTVKRVMTSVRDASSSQTNERCAPMKLTYDKAVDAAYIYLTDEIGVGQVSKTYSCNALAVNGEINLHFDSQGRLVGIEVLDASRLLPVDLLSPGPSQGEP